MDTASDQDLDALLTYLKHQRGFDFSGYKRPSLTRRLGLRMSAVGVESYREYQDCLEVDPEEFSHLFNTILINVTSFFRDPPAWEFLAEKVLPALLAAKGEEAPVRVWDVGCASGEEAYSVAMLLAEVLGREACRERVKIYATDLDERALLKARLGRYSAREVGGIRPELLGRYFVAQNSQYVFDRELRRTIAFGRHNVFQDVPLSRIDLLVCRNVLIYLNADIQREILTRFHRALNEPGYLFLGRAETLLSQNSRYLPVDLKRHIFMKGPESPPPERRLPAPAVSEAAGDRPPSSDSLRDSAFEEEPLALLIIDREGRLALANGRARQLFPLSAADMNRPLQDLELSYRPVELRAGIERAYAADQEVRLPPVDWPHGPTGVVSLAVRILPLHRDGALVGVRVGFEDVTHAQQLEQQLKHLTELQQTAEQEMQASSEELETTNEELQSTMEELETTNEELQSTVEELETTNEELESASEEMETMNEELQSANEELQTVNATLRQRSDELDHSNRFLSTVLNGLKGGVAVLDRDLRVLVWSRPAEELWGVREDEARSRHFLNLDIGLPVARLVEPLQVCLRGNESEVTLEATNRRGRAIRCRVTCLPLDLAAESGAILLMEEVAP